MLLYSIKDKMRKISEYQVKWSGLENRLAQIFDPVSGHCVMLAVDHGYFQGAPEGLDDLRQTIEPLLPYCDCISPCIGGLKCLDQKTRVPIILRATGGNSMAKVKKIPLEEIEDEEEKKKLEERGKKYKEEPIDLDDEIITVPIRDILRTNSIGFTASCYVGMPHQKQTIKNLTDLASEGREYELIAVGITAVGKGLGKGVIYIKHASRLLSENGADIVKTYYCEGFEEVVESCLAPIVIAGGTKRPTEEALEFTYKAIQAGAVGVDMGRNIFQNENPVAMIQAIRKIVHEGKTAEEAFEFYNELTKEKEVKF